MLLLYDVVVVCVQMLYDAVVACVQYSICGKTRGGQQCIFTFFTKPVGINENLGG